MYDARDPKIPISHRSLWARKEEFVVIEEIIDARGTREKRFIISVPTAIIATVVGALVIGTTSVVAATEIASAEAHRIIEEESIRRIIDKENALINDLKLNNISVTIAKGLDKLKFMATQGARTNNLFFKSTEYISKLSHLLEEDRKWKYSDPHSEIY